MVVRVLAGRYELVSFVGRGGMGEVWEGRDRLIGRRVAVKLLPLHQGNESATELFFREARTAGGLNHPGVVTIHDLGQDPHDGTMFLVMEYVDGRDLATLLARAAPPPVPVAVDWTAQTAAALAAAHHAGIVHRDLKPANLMRTATGEIKVLDFGIARFVASTDKSSQVMGTLAYMAPERFDEHPGNARSDLYALGCVLHELLTGRTPFQATGPVSMMAAHLLTPPTPPGKVRPGIPAALDDLVLHLLAKKPEDRPTSATEVADRLRALTETTATARATETPEAVDAGNPEGTAPDTAPTVPTDARYDIPTKPAAPPSPIPHLVDLPSRKPAPVLTRRRAVRLGLAVAVAGTTAGTAAVFLGDDDPNTTPTKQGGSPAPDLAAPAGAPAPTTRSDVRPWRFDAGTYYSPTVTVAAGVVYLGSEKQVFALDGRTGAKKWEERLPVDTSGPTAGGAMVYLGGDDGTLYALYDSGSTKWTFPTGVRRMPRALAVVDGLVYFGSVDKNVYALDAATGAKKWAFATGDSVYSTPTVVDGTVYVGSDDRNVYALDAATGAKKWASPGGGSFRATPAVTDKIVCVTGGDRKLYALDAATGAKKWAVSPDSTGSPPSEAVAAAGLVYIGGGDNCLYALDAATGTEKWSHGTLATGVPTPAVANGLVYVGSRDKYVYAVDALSGSKRWSYKTPDVIESAPVVADGFVYVIVEDGTLYALDARTGAGPS